MQFVSNKIFFSNRVDVFVFDKLRYNEKNFLIFDVVFVESINITYFRFRNRVCIVRNYLIDQLEVVARKLILMNQYVVNDYVVKKNQNKRVFIKTRYSFLDVFDVFQNFSVFSSFHQKTNVFER